MQNADTVVEHLAEHARDVLYRCHLKPTLRCEYISSGVTRVTGRTPEEFYANPDLCLMLITPEAQALPSDRASTLARFDQPFIECWKRKDGTDVWIEKQLVPIYDESGDLSAIEGIARDISQRKRSEDGLQLLADASKIIGRTLDYGTTLQDIARLAIPVLADWCLVDILVEEGGLRRIAIAHVEPTKEMLARELYQRYHLVPPTTAPHWRVMRTGKAEILPEVTVAQLATIAQDPHHLELLQQLGPKSAMFVPLVARGRSIGVWTFMLTESDRRYGSVDLQLAETLADRCATAIDNARLHQRISEARADAEQARLSAEQHAALLADWYRLIAHDLRQPLGIALAHVELLARLINQGQYDKATRSIEPLLSSLRQLRTMSQELIDSAVLESGSVPVHREAIELVDYVRNILTRAAETLDVGRVDIEAMASIRIEADPSLLERVLVNLISNALKYSESDTRVTVQLERAGREAIITVIDRGIGVPADERHRLFERGFRSSRARRNAEGLGLGLYIARLLTESQGGRIWLESSEVDVGTKFCLAIPRILTSEETLGDASEI